MSNQAHWIVLAAVLEVACAGTKDQSTASSAAVGGSGGTLAVTLPTLPTLPTIDVSQWTAGTGALLSCDPSVESASSCGTNTCPALPVGSGASCLVNCCTSDDHCGTRIADPRYDSLGCIAVASTATDPRCPSVTMFGLSLPGCCDAQGQCGQVVGPTCLALSSSKACAAADSGDAGM
jgi:hypothetical protein